VSPSKTVQPPYSAELSKLPEIRQGKLEQPIITSFAHDAAQRYALFNEPSTKKTIDFNVELELVRRKGEGEKGRQSEVR
jgi:hypothetical protein